MVFKELSAGQRKSLEFLRRELKDGAVEVIQLHRRAREARVPIRSLTSSRKLLRIKVSRVGQNGSFVWELPEN
ncbi:MAG: hypothetical protein ACR2MG_20350 [Pyrinomonadaceae bacterium]